MNAQDAQVSDYLSGVGVIFETAYTGETKRDDWSCDSWVVTFRRNKKAERFDFYMGLGNRAKSRFPVNHMLRRSAKPQAPTAASVLYSLLLDASAADESFDEWCSEYEYDSDSRKALAIYLACQSNATRLASVLTHAERSKLSELLHGY